MVPLKISLIESTPAIITVTTPLRAIPAGNLPVYYEISDLNVEPLTMSWVSGSANINDFTAEIKTINIPPESTKAESMFVIGNVDNDMNQQFQSQNPNNCFVYMTNILKIVLTAKKISIPANTDLSQYMYYKNPNQIGTTAYNRLDSLKFTFYSPIYYPVFVYCVLTCLYQIRPTSDYIINQTFKETPVLKKYKGYISTDTDLLSIDFDNVARGLSYVLFCDVQSTENEPKNPIRTIAKADILAFDRSVNVTTFDNSLMSTPNITFTNSTIIEQPDIPLSKVIISKRTVYSECINYKFSKDPSLAIKTAIINYCQYLFSQENLIYTGCLTCVELLGDNT